MTGKESREVSSLFFCILQVRPPGIKDFSACVLGEEVRLLDRRLFEPIGGVTSIARIEISPDERVLFYHRRAHTHGALIPNLLLLENPMVNGSL